MEEEALSGIGLTRPLLAEGVEELKLWTADQPHLPTVTDDVLLKSFIIGSKSVDRAKIRLDNYFTARSKHPRVFSTRDPEKIYWSKCMKILPLAELTDEGYSVLLSCSPTKLETANFDLEESLKVFFMGLDRQLRTTPFTRGQVSAVDIGNFTLWQLSKCSPGLISAAVFSYQNCYPLRVKHLIFFNAPKAFSYFYNNFFKYCLTPKLRSRINITSEDHSVLTDLVPSRLLPPEYGGTNLSMAQLFDKMKEELIADKQWFTSAGLLRSDESKRPAADP